MPRGLAIKPGVPRRTTDVHLFFNFGYMEPKYVSLQTVVDDYFKGRAGKPMGQKGIFEMYNQTGNLLYKHFTGVTVDCTVHPTGDPVITEDIDYELVEPKQLPPSAP